MAAIKIEQGLSHHVNHPSRLKLGEQVVSPHHQAKHQVVLDHVVQRGQVLLCQEGEVLFSLPYL